MHVWSSTVRAYTKGNCPVPGTSDRRNVDFFLWFILWQSLLSCSLSLAEVENMPGVGTLWAPAVTYKDSTVESVVQGREGGHTGTVGYRSVDRKRWWVKRQNCWPLTCLDFVPQNIPSKPPSQSTSRSIWRHTFSAGVGEFCIGNFNQTAKTQVFKWRSCASFLSFFFFFFLIPRPSSVLLLDNKSGALSCHTTCRHWEYAIFSCIIELAHCYILCLHL